MISELDKVYSHDKRQELFNILHSEDASHYQRLYLVGFLKYVGYDIEQVCDIIDTNCSWCDYNDVMTFTQVRGIFRGGHKTGDISLQVSFPQPFLSSKEKAYRGKIPYCTLVYTPCSKCPEKCTIQTLGRLK